MNPEEPGPAADGAGAEVTQKQEPGTCSAELVIFCHPRNVGNLVRSLEDEITHAAGALPMRVLWSGRSHILHQGVIVLEWEGKPTPAFLHSLSIDHEIFDYVVYEYRWAESEEDQASNHEPEEQHIQDARARQIDGEQRVY